MTSTDVQRKPLFCRSGQNATQGYVETREYTFNERLTRTLKTGGLLFGATFICVFIPILHFVLVPVLLVTTVAFSVASWMDRTETVSGEFKCSECGKMNTLPRESASFPHTIRCSHCHFGLRLDLRP